MAVIYVADKVRKLRKQAGLTQRQLAAKLKCHYRTVENWEQGKGIDPYKAEAVLAAIRRMIEENKKPKKKARGKT